MAALILARMRVRKPTIAARCPTQILFFFLLLAAPAAEGTALEFVGRISALLPPHGERTIGTGSGVAHLAPTPHLETLSLTGFVGGSTVIPITDPLVSNGGLVALRVSASFRTADLHVEPFVASSSTPGLVDGRLSLRGEIRFCLLLPECTAGLSLPLSTGPATQGLGVGGVITVGGGTQTINLSLYGAPFTLNTTSVMAATDGGALYTLLSAGSLHGPGSFPSTAGLTISGLGGSVAVVTPIRVVSAPIAPGENDFPGFARIEIRLLPEPGALLPLLVSAGALFILGRRRAAVSRHSEAECAD